MLGKVFVLQDYFSYFQTVYIQESEMEADKTAYRGYSVQRMGKEIRLWTPFTMKIKQMADFKTINT